MAVVLAMSLAGCGFVGVSDGEGSGKDKVSKISLQEAAEQADAIIMGTMSSVRPAVNWVHDAPTESGCDSYTVDGKETGSATRRVAVMTVVSEARRGSLLGVIERYWKEKGYKITGVNRNKTFPAIYASTPEDFRLVAMVGKKGQFFFGITTPCFITSDVEAPKTPPNGTPFEGPVVPDPYVRSDFWSATTAIPSTSPSR
ncbi:hypothetical protein ACFQ61_27455 [Streptomyces sp. NPDC056500]|uniref:hypothetical protein n=1 Tax=Streptomyces sp. NPDC056500 TaxID=3345840 RepID=UPI003692E7F8